MSHVRTQIRDAIATRLTGLTTTGARVYRSRAFSLEDAELPSLSVYIKSEEIAEVTLGTTPTLTRRLALVIEAHASANDDLDTTLDTICAEVETAMEPLLTISGVNVPAILRTTEIEFLSDGEELIGLATMAWSIDARTAEDAPETLI